MQKTIFLAFLLLTMTVAAANAQFTFTIKSYFMTDSVGFFNSTVNYNGGAYDSFFEWSETLFGKRTRTNPKHHHPGVSNPSDTLGFNKANTSFFLWRGIIDSATGGEMFDPNVPQVRTWPLIKAFTGDATNITVSSVDLSGTGTVADSAGFMIGDIKSVTNKTAKIYLTQNKSGSSVSSLITFSSLQSDSLYYYRYIIEKSNVFYYGEVKQFSTLPIPLPVIDTVILIKPGVPTSIARVYYETHDVLSKIHLESSTDNFTTVTSTNPIQRSDSGVVDISFSTPLYNQLYQWRVALNSDNGNVMKVGNSFTISKPRPVIISVDVISIDIPTTKVKVHFDTRGVNSFMHLELSTDTFTTVVPTGTVQHTDSGVVEILLPTSANNQLYQWQAIITSNNGNDTKVGSSFTTPPIVSSITVKTTPGYSNASGTKVIMNGTVHSNSAVNTSFIYYRTKTQKFDSTKWVFNAPGDFTATDSIASVPGDTVYFQIYARDIAGPEALGDVLSVIVVLPVHPVIDSVSDIIPGVPNSTGYVYYRTNGITSFIYEELSTNNFATVVRTDTMKYTSGSGASPVLLPTTLYNQLYQHRTIIFTSDKWSDTAKGESFVTPSAPQNVIKTLKTWPVTNMSSSNFTLWASYTTTANCTIYFNVRFNSGSWSKVGSQVVKSGTGAVSFDWKGPHLSGNYEVEAVGTATGNPDVYGGLVQFFFGTTGMDDITHPTEVRGTLAIYNMLGQFVSQIEIPEGTLLGTIHLDIPNGTYICILRQGSNIALREKIVYIDAH